MFCEKCGREIPEGGSCVCSEEKSIESQITVNHALETVKRNFSSAFILWAIILSGAGAILSFFNSFNMKNATDVDITPIFRFGIVPGIINLIFAVLFCAGGYSFYSSCKRMYGEVSGSGIKLIKYTVIARIVMLFTGVTAVIITVLLGNTIIKLLTGSADLKSLFEKAITSYYPEEYQQYVNQLEEYGYGIETILNIVLGVFLALFIIVIGFALLYEFKILRTVKALNQTVTTGKANTYVSMFWIVMLYIAGIFGAFSVFGAFSNPLSSLAAVCTAIAEILLAVQLGRYKNEILIASLNN